MRLIRKNVEREADGAEAERLMREGFFPLAGPAEESGGQGRKKKELAAAASSLENLTAAQLADMAKAMGLKGYSSLTKKELLEALRAEMEKEMA